MQKAVFYLENVFRVVKTSVRQARRGPQFLPVWEREKLVRSIGNSLDSAIPKVHQIHEITATPYGPRFESDLASLIRIWPQLVLTYGIKEKTLHNLLEQHIWNITAELPQCKLVAVCRRYHCEDTVGPYFNKDFVQFGAERGLYLDTKREPDEYLEFHQLIVEFGKHMCEQYPLIFRDLYILSVHSVRKLVREARERHKKNPSYGRKKSHVPLYLSCLDPELYQRGHDEPHRTLPDFLREKKDLANWFRFTDEVYTQLSDVDFSYIRALDEKSFDPIAQTDHVDPCVQQEIWEQAGLLFAATRRVKLEVVEGAVPSPIINARRGMAPVLPPVKAEAVLVTARQD